MAAARAKQGNCGSSDRGSHTTPAMRASHLAVIPLASPKDTSEQPLLYVLTGYSTPSQAVFNDFGGNLPATGGTLNIASNLKGAPL